MMVHYSLKMPLLAMLVGLQFVPCSLLSDECNFSKSGRPIVYMYGLNLESFTHLNVCGLNYGKTHHGVLPLFQAGTETIGA